MIKSSKAKVLILVAVSILALVFFVACSTSAQLYLVNQMAAREGFVLTESLPYGSEPDHILDVYAPANPTSGHLPVVVFFYGGCWGACTTYKKQQYAFVAEAFTSNQIIAVVADYRLYPSVMFPDMIKDASQVVEWVRRNISAYGGDSSQLFLAGHSAGGHLAAMLTMDKTLLLPNTYTGVKGFIGLAGAYNFLPFDESYMPILFGPPMTPAESQPVSFVDGTEPPSLLLYGNADTRVKRKNIEGLQAKLAEFGSPVAVRYYEGVDHGGIVGAFSVLKRDSQPVFNDVLKFIREHSNKEQKPMASLGD